MKAIVITGNALFIVAVLAISAEWRTRLRHHEIAQGTKAFDEGALCGMRAALDWFQKAQTNHAMVGTGNVIPVLYEDIATNPMSAPTWRNWHP